MSCPICDADVDPKYRPFCSKRCADLDLARWFNGSYAVPSTDPDDLDELVEAMEEELANPQPKPRLS
ncbi:DNA gyrase inhibitor YacG [Pseudooceanicola sediminis]|uniref:DNA gyrase inhibitor YacG n=1 Tax=Pseudooceanicola sediminis TaxID=2211117 RepID=A0A399IZW6_9RHOB|nr:DNA gyrase inhibitor YacG [Pseudooceanicola sediminis]KAA2313924.1 DNA gyrase inhibitor YacG [Puniceibacterium sp. HSS470]RII38738.1 DNA gyrase inhibitor YacG [Pseudooceanicola sediminis]|tara:strand:- start:49114 stop:49314 length:201 start_codon:yes stop_codon:yes gene_type:complete